MKKQRKKIGEEIRQAQQAAGVGGAGAGKGWVQNKGKGKGKPPFRYDRDNNELCFKFAKGGRGACEDVCPQGRVHACQWCLGPHPNSECNKKGGGKNKAGKTPPSD